MPKALAKTRKPRPASSASKASVERKSTAVATKPNDSAPKIDAIKRPRTFEDVIGEQPGPMREIARQLRQLIFDLIPGVSENVYGGSKVQVVLYSLGGPTKTLCGIQPASDECLLYLHHVTPDDSQTLLIEGEGKHSQHVRIDAMTNLVVRDVRRLLTLARRRSKA